MYACVYACMYMYVCSLSMYMYVYMSFALVAMVQNAINCPMPIACLLDKVSSNMSHNVNRVAPARVASAAVGPPRSAAIVSTALTA
jgi:hypothetical protein